MPEQVQVRTVGGVIDYAKLLSPEDKRGLEITAGQLARRIETDFFVVTVDDRAPQWAAQKSHFAMVKRVVHDVQTAVVKHFGREAPLTALLVFKSSVVLHLKSTDTKLQDYLLYENFYGGAAGALDRTRHSGETHAAAAIRYLANFEQTLDRINETQSGPALGAQAERAQFWLFQKTALLKSRELLQHPVLDPFYIAVCTLLSAFTSIMLFPGWVSFLLFMGGLYLGFHVLGYVLENRFGERGETAGDFLLGAGYALPLFILFAVSQGDLENLLYISQKFGGDLLSYLDWSSEIAARSSNLPFWLIAGGAGSAAAMEAITRTARFRTAYRQFEKVDPAGKSRMAYAAARVWNAISLPVNAVNGVIHVLTALGWVLSLIIWPELVAAFFLIVSLLKRAIDVVTTVTSAEHTQRPKHRPLRKKTALQLQGPIHETIK